MAKGLRIAEPPRRRTDAEPEPGAGQETPRSVSVTGPTDKFDQVGATQKVQFNKRITREVADGYEILAIRTRRRVPDLLAEALELLEQRYGRA